MRSVAVHPRRWVRPWKTRAAHEGRGYTISEFPLGSRKVERFIPRIWATRKHQTIPHEDLSRGR